MIDTSGSDLRHEILPREFTTTSSPEWAQHDATTPADSSPPADDDDEASSGADAS